MRNGPAGWSLTRALPSPDNENHNMAQSNSRMPAVYIAGPYRGPSRAAIELNIQVARKVGLLASIKGWAAVIPHSNTGHLDDSCSLPEQYWLDATMELMRRCDAVVLCQGWQHSSGTLAEIAEAQRLGITVFYTDSELPPVEVWRTLPANDNRAMG